MAPTRRLAELFFELRARTEGLQQDLDKSERALGKLTSFVLKNPVTALAAVGTAALSAAAKATQMAAAIDDSMRRVASSVPKGTAGIERLRTTLEQISVATGRTQDELALAAESIARAGAGSAEEVSQRLKAVTAAAQASGTDLQGIIGGLDQTLDLFGLSSASSSEALAELFSVARGKSSLEDLFAQLQAAAPAIQDLGLDLPTAARALVQLGESGLSTKQAATELKALAKEGAAGRAEVERLAATIPKAADPMRDLADAAQRVNDAAVNAGPRLRAELSATLIRLGNEFLPLVNRGFSTMLSLIQRLRGGTTQQLSDAFEKVIDQGGRVFDAINGRNVNQWANTGGQIGEVQRAILRLAEAAREGRLEIEEFGVEGLGKLASNVARLSQQPQLFNAKQRAELLTFLKQITEAQAALTKLQGSGGLGGRAGSTISGTGEDREFRPDSGAESFFKQVKDQIEGTAAVEEALKRVEQDLRRRRIELAQALIATGESTIGTLRQLVQDFEAEFLDQGFNKVQARILADAKLGIKGAKQDISIALQGLAELNKLEDDRKDRDEERGKREAKATEEALNRAQRIGRAVEDIGKLVLTAADAFGVLSDEAAKALSSVIDVGAGIGRLIASGGADGGAQLATGLISLASQAFGNDPAAEERRRQHAENLATLKSIDKNTGDLLGVSTSGGNIASIRSGVASLLSLTGAAGGFRRFGDSGPLRGINEADFLEGRTGLAFKEIEALAKSLGITLNGTKQSYLDFLDALKKLDLEAFTKGFTGQLRRLEIEARLDPAAFQGIDGLIKRLQVLAGPDGAPAIAKALEGLDVTSSEGRASAIERLTATLRNLSSLDVADLGGLSLDQFIEEILSAIEKLREMEPAARSASERFRDALDLVALEFELGGLDAAGRLAKVQAAFAASFNEVFDDLDFSSLDALQASISGIIASLTADGQLTEEEQALAAALRELLAAFQATVPEAQQFSDALQVLADRFEIFRTTARQRFEQLFSTLADQFPSVGDLLTGLDLANDADLAELRRRAQALFETLALDGVSAEEQAIVDAIKQILKAAGEAAEEAAAEEARLLAAAAEQRRRILQGAENRIRLNDITDPVEQLRIRLAALGKAFPELADVLGSFDTATQEGRDALEAWIRSIAESPEELERLAAAMGISVDELLQALLELEDGADAAQTAIETLAAKLQTAFDEVDFDLALNNITDPLERLTRSAKAIAGIVPEIDEALRGIDLRSESGRALADASLVSLGNRTTDASTRDAILRLLNQIRGIGTGGTTGGGGGGFGLTPEGRAAVASAATITEVTANRWLDVATTELALSRQRNATLDAILGTVTNAPAFTPPALGAAGGASAGAAVTYHVEIPVNFYGPVTTADATELGAALQEEIYRLVTGRLATELAAAQRLAGRNRI